VTRLHDVVYVVYRWSSTILRYNATTNQRLTDIDVKDLKDPWDIVACEQTSQLYVADLERERKCIWRVSADGADIKLWWSKSSLGTFEPYTMSVMSTRLLVASHKTNGLLQLDAGGDELRRVQLPDDMEPQHAVESPTGTFIISHDSTQLKQYRISEVNTDGRVLRQFTGSRLSSLLNPQYIAVDSRGNVLVADTYNRRILLLDAQLTLRRVIVDEHQLNYKQPQRLCYMEITGQLLVVLLNRVAVFDVLRR